MQKLLHYFLNKLHQLGYALLACVITVLVCIGTAIIAVLGTGVGILLICVLTYYCLMAEYTYKKETKNKGDP